MFDILKYLEGIEAESSISEGETRKMFELGMTMPIGAQFLELGLLHGRSACLLAYVAAMRRGNYLGVDNFRCGRNSKAEVEGYLGERGLLACATVVESETQSFDTFAYMNPWTDFLHIDADHSSPGVDRDVQKYVPFVALDGIVAVDDYYRREGEPYYPDVSRAIDAACRNQQWKEIASADNMIFFQRISL